jgi:fatty-acid O-methyltransferase
VPLKDRVLHSPFFWKSSQKFSKYFYRVVSRRLAGDDVVFFNCGYEEDPPMSVPLDAADEPNRICIQLYHSTAAQTDLSGKRVLDVGCGHGGGASYVTRTFHPASYTGLDLNATGIAFCQKRHTVPGLEFVQGNAENLPFPDESFDAVINIESSNHYPDLPRFLAEVARVLRPGGHFLYTDLRPRHLVADWEAMLADAPMRMLSQREINEQVMRGMEKNTEHWRGVIDRNTPPWLQRFARTLVPVPDTVVYHDLDSGILSYRMYHFLKE